MYMGNLVVVALGATILLFGITYEYTKLKKGHTNNNNEGPASSLWRTRSLGRSFLKMIRLLFLAAQSDTEPSDG
jgi:hypothetical protein